MNTIGGYFISKQENGTSLKENVIMGKKYRFTVLTDRLIRLEYSEDGVFEDRLSQRVVFRKFPKANFTITQTDLLIQIVTSYFTLSYVKEASFGSGKLTAGSNLKIALNNTEQAWYYGHPESRNFGGITYSLDQFSGNLKLGKGLYSTNGFAFLDDSESFVIDSNGNFIPRGKKNLDLYVFMYRKDLGLCLQDYYTLTGYPMLIPRYALGNWWMKNEKYTNLEVEKLLTSFQENHIPISVFMLGDKWHNSSDPLNFDSSIIEVASLKQLLDQNHIRLGLTVNPSIVVKNDSAIYQNIAAVINTGGKDFSFLPMDNQKLNVYATYGIQNWIGNQIDAFYVDYRDIKDQKTLALLTHYFSAMNGLLKNKRSAVLSRYHQTAAHRDSIVFTGATKVDWNTLAILPKYMQSASNNAISYVASAIGGYYGGVENFELYIRYIQLGVFSSMMVLASDGGKYYKREPWRWNISQFEIIKKYLVLRNQLIPYLYTESYTYHKYGSPLLQPLYYKYPKIYDEPLYKNQYFFGSQMLVCPITKKKNSVMNRVVQRLFIPDGVWYEFESGKKYLGNKYYMSFYKDEDYPVFCKEGAIMVLSLDDTYEIPTHMEIIIYPGQNGSYQLYEDDGISNNYKNGTFSITDFSFVYQKNQYYLSIRGSTNPGLLPETRDYKIRFKNTKNADVMVQSGETAVQYHSYLEKNDFVIELKQISTGKELKVSCSGNDIENSMTRLINDDIKGILEDLEIETILKEKIDKILFGDLPIKKKRIAIRKLKRSKLEPKFIKMFLNLLEYIETV